MKVSPELKRALRAFAQWNLGDQGWADEIIEILKAKDPIAKVNSTLPDGTVESVLGG